MAGGFYSNLDTLEEVKIRVELAQEKTELVVLDDSTKYEQILTGEWITKKVMEGTTNKYGKWTGGESLQSSVFEPERWMQVTVTATLDEQIIKKTEQVFLIQQVAGSVGSTPP